MSNSPAPADLTIDAKDNISSLQRVLHNFTYTGAPEAFTAWSTRLRLELQHVHASHYPRLFRDSVAPTMHHVIESNVSLEDFITRINNFVFGDKGQDSFLVDLMNLAVPAPTPQAFEEFCQKVLVAAQLVPGGLPHARYLRTALFRGIPANLHLDVTEAVPVDDTQSAIVLLTAIKNFVKRKLGTSIPVAAATVVPPAATSSTASKEEPSSTPDGTAAGVFSHYGRGRGGRRRPNYRQHRQQRDRPEEPHPRSSPDNRSYAPRSRQSSQ